MFDMTINIPSLISIFMVFGILLRLSNAYGKIELKVEEMWKVFIGDRNG